MFSNISEASVEEFWNLSYNSVQGQIEKHPNSPNMGGDVHKRYKAYLRRLTKHSSLYDNFDTAAAMYSHALLIINAICAEVEKNIAYDIAVACNEYGITNRTPGEYSDINAISILSSIFNDPETRLIYRESNSSSAFDMESKNIFLSGHDLYDGVDTTASQALTHIHLRALLLDIICRMCKVIKSQNRLTGKKLVSVENQPAEEDKVSRGYVTVNSNVDRIKLEAVVTQLFLPVVDNVDPSKGPVRWQINYGDWTESGLELENQDFVDQFVLPKGVEKTLAGEFSIDIELEGHVIPSGDLNEYIKSIKYTPEELGTPEARQQLENNVKNTEASIRANFGFLLRKEDIVPYNFIDNKELPIRSFAIVPPRGGLSPIIKSCIYHREDSRRLIEYLKAVSRHFSQAQQSMEGLIKDPAGVELAETATLPGIEANEIIKYSSLRQTFLRSFLASEEAGISTNGYAPSATYIDSKIDKNVIKDIINSLLFSASLIEQLDRSFKPFLGKNYSAIYNDTNLIPAESRQSSDNHLKFGRIITLGIPSGYIDSNKSGKPLDVLNRVLFFRTRN